MDCRATDGWMDERTDREMVSLVKLVNLSGNY
jgi:hypothetical protein